MGAEKKDIHIFRYEFEQAKAENRVWFSEDIGTLEDEILKPADKETIYIETINIVLPNSLSFLSEIDFIELSSQTRSRFAQLGLEVLADTGNVISQTLYNEEHQQRAEIHVVNLSKQPISLPKGTRFFNLYYRPPAFLEEADIRKLFGNQISVEGKEGTDWGWWIGDDGFVCGLELFLDPDKVMYIPESKNSNDPPITIRDGKSLNHNRGEVDMFLEKVPQSLEDESLLWIGQTLSHLSLGPTVHAQIDNLVGQGAYQTNSIILRGGNTNSRIRTEIWSSTAFQYRPRSIKIRFLPA